MPDDNGPTPQVSNPYQAAVAIAQRSIIGVLFFAFGWGVFELFDKQEDTSKELVYLVLNRCLPNVIIGKEN